MPDPNAKPEPFNRLECPTGLRRLELPGAQSAWVDPDSVCMIRPAAYPGCSLVSCFRMPDLLVLGSPDAVQAELFCEPIPDEVFEKAAAAAGLRTTPEGSLYPPEWYKDPEAALARAQGAALKATEEAME